MVVVVARRRSYASVYCGWLRFTVAALQHLRPSGVSVALVGFLPIPCRSQEFNVINALGKLGVESVKYGAWPLSDCFTTGLSLYPEPAVNRANVQLNVS